MESKEAPLGKKLGGIKISDGEPDRDDILNGFLEYVDELGIELYPAQEEAVLELLEWKHVVLNTPTGSGKSLVAMALHFQALAEGRRSFYTCPIKALVNEKFFDLCDVFGPENVALLTGDASVNRDAPIVCCTAEILSNMALRDENLSVDYVVMDEFHFYGDEDRGSAWQIPLITMRETVFLLMSATLGDTTRITDRLNEYTDRETARVSGAKRPVPLEFDYRETTIHETIQELLEKDAAPIYLVNFTQRGCAEQAQSLLSLNVCSKDQKKILAAELKQVKFDTPYGKELTRFLRAGIGVHHAGLLPKYRLTVEKLSQAGLLKVVCGTDSLGVGVNIPIRTVVFRQLCKFDGTKTRILSARQFHQISGRAGRKGFDDLGRVVVQSPEHVSENRQIEAKLVKNPHLKNKLRKKKAPTRGYVHWDKSTFERLTASPPEPLEQRFEVNHGMLINVLQRKTSDTGGGYRWFVKAIGRSHGADGKKKMLRVRLATLARSLRNAEIIDLVKNEGRPGSSFKIREGFQSGFSLNQSLSLFLVEAAGLLDKESETFALDMLSLVESILENPKVVLFAQERRIKDVLIAKLKAEGVPYEDRMDALEKVEYPKPNEEFIYSSFNEFAKYHPWLDGENIRPKTIARDMFERCHDFADYINEMGLHRSEGILLRHLSQVYKTAKQNVPESYHTEEFYEVLTYFYTMIKRVDSSLLDEWESMMNGEIVRLESRYEPKEDDETGIVDLASDFKALSARVRNELYLLQRSLADRNFEDACLRIKQRADDEWTPRRFEDAMKPYFEEHSAIDITPRARQPVNTFIREVSTKLFDVQQKIIDPDGEEDWALICKVDLQETWNDQEPLVELERIGV